MGMNDMTDSEVKLVDEKLRAEVAKLIAKLKFLGLISHKWLNANHNIGFRPYRYWTRLRSGRLA